MPRLAKRDLNLQPKNFGSLSFWLCKRVPFSAKMHFWAIFMAALVNQSQRSSTRLHASCGKNLLKMAPNAFASIRFGGKVAFFARQAIIRVLKKRTYRHPLFAKAVSVPYNSSIVQAGLAHSVTASH